MIISSGVCLQMVVLGALLRPLPKKARLQLRNKNKHSGSHDARFHVQLHLYGCSCLLSAMGAYTFLLLAIKFGIEQGLAYNKVVLFFSFLGISCIFCRVFLALVAGLSWFKIDHAYNFTNISMGILLGVTFMVSNEASFATVCIIFGILYGGNYGLRTAVNVEIFGVDNLITVEGDTAVYVGLGSIGGPYLAGKILVI